MDPGEPLQSFQESRRRATRPGWRRAALRARQQRSRLCGRTAAGTRNGLLHHCERGRVSGDALEGLCRAAGIAATYTDIWGNIRTASNDTRIALLASLGIPATDADAREALEREEARAWRRLVPPVIVCRESRLPYRVTLNFPESAAEELQGWRLAMESGDSRSGEFRPRQLELLQSSLIAGERYVQVAFDWKET